MERPTLRFHYSPRLALRAALRFERGGGKHLPTPEEMAAVNEDWERDVYTMLDWIAYHRDWHKLPKDWQS